MVDSNAEFSAVENGPQQPAPRETPPFVPGVAAPSQDFAVAPIPPGPQVSGLVPAHAAVGYPQSGAQMVAPKNGALGLIVSFFIPGVGSMINGSVGRGVVILVGYIIAWIFSLVLIGIPFLIGIWIWGLADGYLSAQRWNRAHGIIS